MASVKAYIILLCLAGYLVAAEARFLNLVVKDDADSAVERNVRNANGASIKASDIVRLLKYIPRSKRERRKKEQLPLKYYVGKLLKIIPRSERERRQKEEQQALKKYGGKLLKQRGPNIYALRFTNYHVPTVSNFLQTLNNFLTRNSNNNYIGKRDACNSGFGTPESRNRCKRQKKNRLFMRKWKRDMRRKYAQHMLVERSRSDSDSYSDERDSDDNYASDGNDSDENKASDDDGSDENASDDNKDINDYNSNEDSYKGKKKSRFQIVDNAKAKRERERKTYSSESEEVRKPTYSSDETDKFSSSENSEQKPQQDTEYSGNELSAESLEEHKPSKIDKKEKYMYLQGSRLQKPYQRAHDVNGRRDPSRMRHFLPKRFNWDPDMIHDIRDFWNHGLKIQFKDYLMKT